ncbi:hypothetical protein [Pluralibacter gergoviae]|uniref:DNA-binding protein n=1 Tax=Pluralibacter gergoviae TaxID=61647 RepID=A0AAW8HQP9_PLUGE|nr:hypothetical protein [Pluralibacter gergoviae]AVR04446.1 hypothetical protein A8H26_17935 [Pluralibacter gergoviae]KMK01347.1 hypothetical protein ABW08_23835 [Pluralibacter gergoviae]KMK20916.1 hypothetical protein ABW11_24755 [Pluralibacter gergoviae]MDQ2310838.1 hypothetical protein [Pluralibacter gergoviae]SUB71208.1 Uncharacterised protein [Pluralibacter gergoviae]
MLRFTEKQLAILSEKETVNYIDNICSIIRKNAPSLSDNEQLPIILKDADEFVTFHEFKDKGVRNDFLILSAFEPYFYKTEEMQSWLLHGKESVEREYIKYRQISDNVFNRLTRGTHE